MHFNHAIDELKTFVFEGLGKDKIIFRLPLRVFSGDSISWANERPIKKRNTNRGLLTYASGIHMGVPSDEELKGVI